MENTRKIVSIFVIALLFAHSNFLMLYYVLYKCNVEELTESCCKKQVVNCNASCYLSFKMAQQDETNGRKGESSDVKLKISEFVFNASDLLPVNEIKQRYISFKDKSVLEEIFHEIDHPPQI